MRIVLIYYYWCFVRFSLHGWKHNEVFVFVLFSVIFAFIQW